MVTFQISKTFTKATLGHIASFLGITPGRLSAEFVQTRVITFRNKQKLFFYLINNLTKISFNHLYYYSLYFFDKYQKIVIRIRVILHTILSVMDKTNRFSK